MRRRSARGSATARPSIRSQAARSCARESPERRRRLRRRRRKRRNCRARDALEQPATRGPSRAALDRGVRARSRRQGERSRPSRRCSVATTNTSYCHADASGWRDGAISRSPALVVGVRDGKAASYRRSRRHPRWTQEAGRRQRKEVRRQHGERRRNAAEEDKHEASHTRRGSKPPTRTRAAGFPGRSSGVALRTARP